MAAALAAQGLPDTTLRRFAEHIHLHILTLSARFAQPSRRRARLGLAGCFTYEPPPGDRWIPANGCV